ncbi:MAG TPA: hypothetical protein VIH99_13860 [Bdellovibrionota bacterium]|jgi:hypothetical protein
MRYLILTLGLLSTPSFASQYENPYCTNPDCMSDDQLYFRDSGSREGYRDRYHYRNNRPYNRVYRPLRDRPVLRDTDPMHNNNGYPNYYCTNVDCM